MEIIGISLSLSALIVLAESKIWGFSAKISTWLSRLKPLENRFPGSWGFCYWEQAAPYQHPKPGQEDHLGFNTWQWYTEVIKNKTGKKPKLILLWAGAENRNSQVRESSRILEIQSLLRDRAADGLAMPLPDNLLAICYHQVCRAPRNRPSQPSLFWSLTEEQTQVLKSSMKPWHKANLKPVHQSITIKHQLRVKVTWRLIRSIKKTTGFNQLFRNSKI